MNLNLVSLAYLISIVACGTSGRAKISSHYYDVDLPRLDTNPVFCGYKGSHMDINRITAVQSLTLNECGACLKVTAKNGKFVYVMAVDKGGFGLDLNKKSFIQLFGINSGRFDAKWEKTEASHCKGILKGGNYKTPGLNESSKGKGRKKKLDVNEIENHNIQSSDTFTSKQDIDYLHNSEYSDDELKKFSKQYNKNKGKRTETRRDIEDLDFNAFNYQDNKELDTTNNNNNVNFRKKKPKVEEQGSKSKKDETKKTQKEKPDKKERKSHDNKGTKHSSHENNYTLIHGNGKSDIETIYESQTHNDDNDNNEDKVNYRKMQSLTITNDKSGNARDDIGDIADIDFRKVKNQPSKKVSNDIDDITKHTFRRMKPNSVREKAKKDSKNNVEHKYYDYENNRGEDLEHINPIDYRKKSDKDKSKKNSDKDKKKKKTKKDNKKDEKKENSKKKEPEEIKDNQKFELSEYTKGDVTEIYFGDD